MTSTAPDRIDKIEASLWAAADQLRANSKLTIIVISDEAHRTQAGRLARNMRLALPNAAFIGFTGTPLFKHDQLTRRIFGGYVSRYDFKRSEEAGSRPVRRSPSVAAFVLLAAGATARLPAVHKRALVTR